MNRHQSNPFLAGWEEANTEPVATNIPDAPDLSSAALASGGGVGQQQQQQTRRHSNVDSSSNSFTTQRNVDMRLYRRNMSSFEAASLQLEQQQQMLESNNGKTADLISAHKDLIAKMTADFQTAIESNDRQYGSQDADGNQLGINPFDPFETIVDDDVSIPSPATPLNQNSSNQDKFKIENHDRSGPLNDADANEELTDRPASMRLEQQETKQKVVHDSIDDDDAELVSTPVRNIKSSSKRLSRDEASAREGGSNGTASGLDNHVNRIGEDRLVDGKDLQDREQRQQQDSESMTKASLFASLLASAESSSQQVPIESSTDDRDRFYTDNGSDTNINTHENIENATRVIKGSPSAADGNMDRPVSFFDPFETVIDKDALTSLVNENLQGSTRDRSQVDQTHVSAPEDESSKVSAGVSDGGDANMHIQRPSRQVAESTSIETVIENTTTRQNSSFNATKTTYTSPAQADVSTEPTKDRSTVSQDAQGCEDLKKEATDQAQAATGKDEVRPLGAARTQVAAPSSSSSMPRPSAKKSSQRPRKQMDDESSDSSDDDRIQIVIKARDTSGKDADGSGKSTNPIIVPLLPPPPSKSSMKQARERGQVDDIPSPVMSYKSRQKTRKSTRQGEADRTSDFSDDSDEEKANDRVAAPPEVEASSASKQLTASTTTTTTTTKAQAKAHASDDDTATESADEGGQFVIPMTHSDDESDNYGKPETPLYDDDTSYVLEDFPPKYEGSGWEMMLRYPPKKKLTSNRFWKRIFVRLAQVPLAPPAKQQQQEAKDAAVQLCWALQIFDKAGDKKPMQEIPIQATYTVSEISSQLFDQFGKIFTIKLQYIFYKERVGVRQGQLARFIHTGHVGSSTTSGGHGVDPISIGAIKRMGAPIEHSPQISQIIKLGCTSYDDIRQFKDCLEDCLFRMPIHRDRALTTYKTEEVQMAVRDEAYLELNQIGTITKQLARVRLFFLSFLNGTPIVEIGVNDIHRQGREVVGRMDILPVVTEEWIRLEAWELHSTIEKEEFEKVESRIIKLTPPDATFFELMRFRVRPPRNRELPLQVSANMSVTRTKVSINCEVMVPGSVSRKHGQIPCENIAIRIHIPECWIYFFREEKHFRMGSKKSVNRRPGKVKGIERFLGGGGTQDFNDDSSLIEVTSGQAKYEHHHHAIVWRAARWPKENRAAYVQNTMRIRLPLSAFDKMPENFYEYVHVEYTMPATTVSHTTLRSISVNPCDDEPPEKYVKYAARYDYKVKMRLSVNLGSQQVPGNSQSGQPQPEASPIVIMKQPDLDDDLQREEDSFDDSDRDDDDDNDNQGDHNVDNN